jgi:hypothetical protein
MTTKTKRRRDSFNLRVLRLFPGLTSLHQAAVVNFVFDECRPSDIEFSQ